MYKQKEKEKAGSFVAHTVKFKGVHGKVRDVHIFTHTHTHTPTVDVYPFNTGWDHMVPAGCIFLALLGLASCTDVCCPTPLA